MKEIQGKRLDRGIYINTNNKIELFIYKKLKFYLLLILLLK